MINFLETMESLIDIENSSCKGTRLFPIFEAAQFFIVIIQISIPFVLVIWGSLDWFKAMIAHDEKEMRLKRKPFIQRVIAALLVLVLPWLVKFISIQLSGSGTADFWTCYAEAKPRLDFSGMELSEESYIKNNNNVNNSNNSNNSNSTGICQKDGGTKKCECSVLSQSSCSKDDYGNTCGWYTDTEKGETKPSCHTLSPQKCRYDHGTMKCHCEKIGDKNKCTKDDYGNTCYYGADANGRNVGCHTIPSQSVCKSYGGAKNCECWELGSDACTKDDYGNTCSWKKNDNSSSMSCQKVNN